MNINVPINTIQACHMLKIVSNISYSRNVVPIDVKREMWAGVGDFTCFCLPASMKLTFQFKR